MPLVSPYFRGNTQGVFVKTALVQCFLNYINGFISVCALMVICLAPAAINTDVPACLAPVQ